MSPARSIVLLLLALLAWSSVAMAQPRAVVPPRAKDVPQVSYPKGGRGDAEVVLVLVVDADGSVRSSEVQTGEEPFAEAARKASASWRFSPATRDDEPVPAKIRFLVSFVQEKPPQPKPEDASEPAGPPPAPERELPSAPTPVDDRAIEVTVEGERVELPPSVTSFTRAEVRQLPGAFGDPFRAIEVLPGVTPMIAGLPYFYVRGAPPGNVGYFLDGIRIPYLFHVAAGPSVINPAMVERVDLYSGGYPAEYGRYAGAIVSAETTAPPTAWRGEAVLRLVDAGAMLEGVFADGRATAMLGGRYSYITGLFSLISPDIDLVYRDYQGRVTFDVTDRDRLTLLAFGSYDFLSQTDEVEGTEEEIETVIFGSEFYRVDGRYDARLHGGGNLRAGVTWGFDQTRLIGSRNSQNNLVGTRVRVSRPLSDEVTLRAGFDMQIDNLTADERFYADPDAPYTKTFNDLFPARSDEGIAGWMDVVWKPSKRLEVIPGLRVDTYISEGEKVATADPRLAVVAHVTDDLRILHALGMANQTPSFVVPVPGLAVASLAGGLQRSLQASSGVELDLPYRITATVTGFTGVFLNMTDALGAQQDPTEGELMPRSLGGAKGIEIYIRRALTERLGGFLSYTFSRSTRSVGRERFLATFDRPHVFHSAVGYDLGSGWRSGLRFSLYSGTPTGESEEQETDPLNPPPLEESDQVRDPVFYRVDFRLEKRWGLGDTAWISFVLEMINATLTKETFGGEEIGPVMIPSIGLEGGF